MNDDFYNIGEKSAIIAGLEIASTARHEAKNIIESCQVLLAILYQNEHSKISDEKASLDKLSARLVDLNKVIDRIKYATKSPILKAEPLSIEDTWNEAVSALYPKLLSSNISATFVGQDFSYIGYKAYLRHAFINLILNSVTAYRKRSNYRDKDIKLELIEKDTNNKGKILISYADNAGGIDLGNLDISDEIKNRDKSLNEIIFRPHMTSKGSDGSGWGLYLVKKAIELNKGSIELIRTRGGVTFLIKMDSETNG